MIIKNLLVFGCLLAAAGQAQAVNLVANGSFDSVTAANTYHAKLLADGTANLASGATYITGWTVANHATKTPQVWWYPTGAADVRTNAPLVNTTGNWNTGWAIYGPANGVANGFTVSPQGGALVEIDAGGDYRASLDQIITGLIVGRKYDLSFYWAAGQQTCCGGTTTEQMVVSLGSETHATAVWNNPVKGFSGWTQETFTYTATATSELLSFLANGTPSGYPPITLLDGVSMTQSVPEPASWAMMVTGFGIVGAAVRRRRVAAA